MTLAAGTEALIAVVPRGAEHFRVHFTANDDLDTKLRTHDSPNSYCVAGYGCKLGSGRQACPSIVASELVDYAPTNGCNTADHEGMTITFSGDDVVGPVREMIYISTTVTRTLYYRVHAFRSATFTATWDFGDFPRRLRCRVIRREWSVSHRRRRPCRRHLLRRRKAHHLHCTTAAS